VAQQGTIVRNEYPVEALPEDLRDNLPSGGSVRLVIDDVPEPTEMPLTTILDKMRRLRTQSDDAVVRIRALRAEGDHRDELLGRIRAGDA
jgi:hypothetical protein